MNDTTPTECSAGTRSMSEGAPVAPVEIPEILLRIGDYNLGRFASTGLLMVCNPCDLTNPPAFYDTPEDGALGLILAARWEHSGIVAALWDAMKIYSDAVCQAAVVQQAMPQNAACQALH